VPTYEYECKRCGERFELRQAIQDAPVAECPQCRGEVHRLVSGGAGFILKLSGRGHSGRREGACSFDEAGETCCGRDERCGAPSCGTAKE
jgi:putative FmdB family regulatory protein